MASSSAVENIGDELLAFTAELQRATSLEAMLQSLVDRATRILGVDRVSVRILDASRTRLFVGARAGAPLHGGAGLQFRIGEGLVGWIAQNRVRLRLADGEYDPRFVPNDALREPMGSFLGVPLLDREECIGVLSAVHPRQGYFSEAHERSLVLAVALTAPLIQIERLQRLVNTDPLTGAYNLRGLEAAFGAIGAAGTFTPASIALLDIDRFEALNDAHGREAGDRALLSLVRVLEGVVRRGDSVARRGGDEFVLLLPGTPRAEARRIAERVRLAAERFRMIVQGRVIRITLSAGIAERRADESLAAWVHRASEALYLAKRTGRNRVEHAR